MYITARITGSAMKRHLRVLFIAFCLSLFASSLSAQSEPVLNHIAPTMIWGTGQPRDIVWTPSYVAVATSASVYVFDPADLSGAPRQLAPIGAQPIAIVTNPADANQLAVVTGSIVTLWNIDAGTPLRQWQIGNTPLVGPQFSTDGTRLLANNGFQAFIWDTNTGMLLQTLGDEAAPISAAALSPDAALVFSGSTGGALALWDVATGQQLASDFPYSADLGLSRTTVVAFTPDGRRVLSSDSNGHIRLWSVSSLADTVEYERPYMGDPNTPTVNRIVFLNNDTFITSESSARGGLRLWQIGDDAITLLASYDTPGFGSAGALALSPDGTQVAAVMRYQNGVRPEIFDVSTLERFMTIGDFRDLQSFALSDDGTQLVTEGLGTQAILSTVDGERGMRLQLNSDYLTGAAISEDNNLVTGCVSEAAISYDPMVVGWSVRESSEPFTLLDEFAFTSGGICQQTFISGETVGFVSYDGIYTAPSAIAEFALALPAPDGIGTYAALAGDIGLIGTVDNGFFLFEKSDPAANPRNVVLPWMPQFERTAPIQIALNAGGTHVARTSEAAANAIDVYDISGAEPVLLWTLATDSPITELALSADGRWLASGSKDGSVTLWDVANGRAQAALSGSLSEVRTLAFSPSGDRLYGTGHDSTIKVWVLP
jgi:WD40 repeat protein